VELKVYEHNKCRCKPGSGWRWWRSETIDFNPTLNEIEFCKKSSHFVNFKKYLYLVCVHLTKKQNDWRLRRAECNRSRSLFRIWLAATRFADWNEPADSTNVRPSISTRQSSNRVVFWLEGIITELFRVNMFSRRERNSPVSLCWIGTHAGIIHNPPVKRNDHNNKCKFPKQITNGVCWNIKNQ